jgi:competence protein ComEA
VLEAAEIAGAEVAAAGAVLVCGGLGGVMEAACRGARSRNGLTVGLLPGEDRADANGWVSLAIPTGLGEGRNLLVARAADAVVAVGGGWGTLSEIAFACKIGRPVFGVGTWRAAAPEKELTEGVQAVDDPAEAVRGRSGWSRGTGARTARPGAHRPERAPQLTNPCVTCHARVPSRHRDPPSVPAVPEISRTQLAIYAVAVCLIVWLGARQLGRDGPAPAPQAAGAPAGIELRSQTGGRVTIHVAGAVRRPGVYRLRAGSRVEAAVRSAGGPTRRADLDGLNLAGKLEDGRQIVVPLRPPAGAAGTASAAPGAGTAAEQPIDLNRATLEQLDTLDGVGPATAQKILDYREEHGGFGSVEELGQVPGIGEKRLAALRERVRV